MADKAAGGGALGLLGGGGGAPTGLFGAATPFSALGLGIPLGLGLYAAMNQNEYAGMNLPEYDIVNRFIENQLFNQGKFNTGGVDASVDRREADMRLRQDPIIRQAMDMAITNNPYPVIDTSKQDVIINQLDPDRQAYIKQIQDLLGTYSPSAISPLSGAF